MLFMNVYAGNGAGRGGNGGGNSNRSQRGGMPRDGARLVQRPTGIPRDRNGRLVIPRVFPMRRDKLNRMRQPADPRTLN